MKNWIASLIFIFSAPAFATIFADVDYPGQFEVPVQQPSDYVQLQLRNNTSPRNTFNVRIGFAQGMNCHAVSLSPFGADANLLVYYSEISPNGSNYCELSWQSPRGFVQVRLTKSN